MASAWRTSPRCHFVNGELRLARRPKPRGVQTNAEDPRIVDQDPLLLVLPTVALSVWRRSLHVRTPLGRDRGVNDDSGGEIQSLLKLWRPDEVLACCHRGAADEAVRDQGEHSLDLWLAYWRPRPGARVTVRRRPPVRRAERTRGSDPSGAPAPQESAELQPLAGRSGPRGSRGGAAVAASGDGAGSEYRESGRGADPDDPVDRAG